jgi:rare lipoprotein A
LYRYVRFHRPFGLCLNGSFGDRFTQKKDTGLTAEMYSTLSPAALVGTNGFDRSKRVLRLASVLAAGLVVANCAGPKTSNIDPKYGVSPSPKVVADGESVPKGGGYSKVGKPYTIAGEVYTPKDMRKYSAVGLASWYGSQFRGRMTANGEVFDMDSVTAAHPTMPLPSYIRVTNTANGRSIIARVNDRGPFHSKRLIDVSERVAEALAFRGVGTARVKVDYIGRAPTEGSDDALLMASLRTDGAPASLRGDAKAPVQVASNDQPDSVVVAPSNSAPNVLSFFNAPEQPAAQPATETATVLDADAFVPLPPVRPRASLMAVNLIPAKPALLGKAVASEPTLQTASIPMPIPRPGGMFYAPTSGFSAPEAFNALTPQRFVPMN